MEFGTVHNFYALWHVLVVVTHVLRYGSLTISALVAYSEGRWKHPYDGIAGHSGRAV
jgi:hypothetical protein